MALRDIKQNKAYIARQSGVGTSSPDAFNSNWTDPTAPVVDNTPSGVDQNFDQGDEFLSPMSGDTNFGQSFNYSTGKFANGNTPVSSTKVAMATPTSTNTPSTFGNLNTGQKTVQIAKSQNLGSRNLEDIYDPNKEENKLPSFDFNTQLSNLYGKGLTDKSALYGELSKDKSFASLDSIKQQEYVSQMSQNIKDMMEAKSKADMTNQNFDPVEYAKQKGFDIQSGDAKEIQKGWKELTDTLKYQGTIYDNNVEDLKLKQDLTLKNIDQQIEKTKIDVNRQIDDVAKNAQETIALGEKVGALKGYNKSGGYIQGLMNIQQESMKTITRLQQDLQRIEGLAGEEKALAMDEYNKNMKRAKEDFDYKMRDVIAEGNIELSKVVMGKYDPKKLGEMLDNISYDVIQKRMNIEAQYLNNMKSANDMVTQQFDQFRAMDDYTDKQRQEYTSILNANNGEALASMSGKDIENAVSQGRLSQQQGAAYYQSMVSKSIAALNEYGIPTQQDVDTIINSIKNGSTPLQSVAKVVQSNPNRYSGVKDKFMTVGENSMVFDTKTGQFIQNPMQKVTGTSASYTGPTIPAANPQVVNQKLTQFTNIKDGTTVGDGWCGTFVNNYTQSLGLGRMFVDPIDVRKTQTNSNTPTVGSIALFDRSNDPKASPEARKYGHVAIVMGINSDGTVRIKEQNGTNSKKVGTRNVSASSIYGYFDPTKGLGGNQTQLGFDQTDIAVFNSMTPTDKRKAQNDPLYNKFIDEKYRVMSDKNSSINDIMKYSMGGNNINQTQETQLAKYSQGLDQISGLQNELKGSLTGPVLGKIRSMNPYDTNAQTIKAQLTALVPTIARGAYGEVGVLTDADVELYKKTIPNLSSTEDVNKALLAFTLKSLANGYKTKLSSMAGGGFDVSGYGGEYDRLTNMSDNLLGSVSQAKSLLGELTNIAKTSITNTKQPVDKKSQLRALLGR